MSKHLYRMPAEWEKQKSTIVAWPHNKNDWPKKFFSIPCLFAEIISKISKYQKVNILIQRKRSNVLIMAKDKKLNLVATDLDLVLYDEIEDLSIENDGSTTTSAAVLYDILRKISANTTVRFDLTNQNRLNINSENSDFNLEYKLTI